ncbi:restriction endonuclease subunit S (plasmid) [Lactococcus lactis subsp. lactis]|uniref:restriction endonuclease subunit S n=1 Tax=Lactococcus TaxID=1357 RepID=UPI0021A4207A|nr:restriction endonuclease subunit S [Lactococcus lactis]MCT3103722.1 restriction endonuclease subunit S [Lactococcus lactis]
MMSKKSPQLRFEGFTDDWEDRKLKDVTERVRSNDGRMDLPTLTMSASSGWLDQKDRFSGDISGKEKKNYTLLKKGELSYNHGNSKLAKYGVVFSLTNYEEALVPRVYHSFKALENTSADFIEYMFSTKLPDRELGKLVSSGARMDGLLNINYDDFMNIHISIPNYEEQILVSAFFRKLDETIALHQRKLDLLKEQKKGFLQKMFPKNGAKVPELRFAGFADDWELRKSKELCTISTGKGNTQDKVDDGAYPFYVRSATIEKSDEYLYDQEAVLTVGDGAGTGKVYHYVNGKYNLHQRVYRMYDFKDVSAKYFYYYFSKNFYKRVMSMTAKTSVDSVRMEMIADMNIVFPSVKEQENIVELFSNLDNTIALHQRKLDLLKEQKKGFLQKMFV